MNLKTYKQVQAGVALFIAMIVSIASVQNSYPLAIAGIVTGLLFMLAVRSRTRIRVDEREKTVREQAAQLTYAIFTPALGLGSFILNFSGRQNPYLFAIGQVFAYLTLFLITLYSVSYYCLNRKYGGGGDDE